MFDHMSEISFLAGAENRVRVLEAVVETPRDRYELERHLDISRATTVRILTGLEDRRWVASTGDRYQATPLGEMVLTAFTEFHDTVAASQRLASIAHWFPVGNGVGLDSFIDASITVPTASDSVAPIRRATECMREARTVRGVASGIAPEPLRVNRDCVVERGQSFEVVFSSEVLRVIDADPSMSGWFVEILDAGGLVYEHGAVPHHYGLFDRERVGIGLVDATGTPRAYLVSENDVVVDWAEETFQTFCSAATPVDPDDYR
jgi:predicted transcriptional regulator